MQVFENGEAMPVTAERAAPLPVGAHVVVPERGRRGGLAAGAERRCPTGGPATGPVAAGHRLRRVRAGRELRADRLAATRCRGSRRSAGRRSTRAVQGTGLALALAVPLRPPRSSCSSWPPGCCWPAAIVGRPRRTARRRRRERDAEPVSPAHHSRERRWRVLALVVLVVAGVGIGAGTRGTPAPARRAGGAERAGRRARRGVVRLVLHRPVHRVGRVAGLPRPHQHDERRPVTGTITAVTDGGASERTAVAVPAARRRGAVHPCAVVGFLGVRDRDRRRVAAWRSPQAVHGSSGWSQAPCQSTTSRLVVLPRRHDRELRRALRLAAQSDVDARRGRPQLHDARRRRPPDQLPGDRAAAGSGPGGERGVRGAERVDASAPSCPPGPAASWRPRSRCSPGPPRGLALVPGAAHPESQWAIPQAQEVPVVTPRSTSSTRDGPRGA